MHANPSKWPAIGAYAQPSRPLASPRRITATVPDKLYRLLVARSNHEGRSVSNLVAFLLEQALGKQDPLES
jgi:hypothetical protein